MIIDVVGRIKNTALPTNKPLLPLYEAIVNSIQAIEDAKEKNGHINITILRDKNLISDQHPELGDIIGFEINDNGIGFDEENYRSFETSDTLYKAQRGGKGIGRFLWLKAFERVEVSSHFLHDGKMNYRSFEFVSEGDGTKKKIKSTSKEEKCSTIVRLIGFREKYQQQCPKKLETIATHLIEHCLEYFILSDCPEMTLNDNSTGQSLRLKEVFERETAAQFSHAQVSIENHKFHVLHVRLHSSHVKDHQIHFCADKRVVKSEKLLGRLPNLARHLQDEAARDFIYAAYVDGKTLNESVNAERTDFLISEDDSDSLTKTINWKQIRDAIFQSCSVFLKAYTEPIREKMKKRIESFVATDGPMYRPILKHIEGKIDLLDPEINDDALDSNLYQAYHDLQVALKVQGQHLLQQEVKKNELEEFSKQLEDYFDKVSDINKADLARYVCHRRAVLDFLNKQLGLSGDGKYHLEERIHKIIFPLRKTSDEISFDEHNLWVLDEKLVYHTFLASDKSLSSNPGVITDSRKEPDLLVFDKACAFAVGEDTPYSAITIIEFKRPMRDDYSENDNPVLQIINYIRDIRDGKAKTNTGRDIPIGKDIPFFCYVVADITPSLIKQASNLDLTELPGGQGFFGFRKQFNAYIEVVSYTKMVTDAKKRNAAFFRKLGLPDRIS